MNNQDLINAIAQKSGLSEVQAEKALNSLTTSITSALKNKERVTIVGFGTFSAASSAQATDYGATSAETAEGASAEAAAGATRPQLAFEADTTLLSAIG